MEGWEGWHCKGGKHGGVVAGGGEWEGGVGVTSLRQLAQAPADRLLITGV